jgi:tyrosinase
MRFTYASALLAVAGSAVALPQNPAGSGAPAPLLPPSSFDTDKFARPLSLNEALSGVNATVTTIKDNIEEVKQMMPKLKFPPLDALMNSRDASDLDEELEKFEKRQSTCSNPRIRTEWDSYSNSDRQAYVNAVKCLQSRPASGQFSASRSRYEDLVALHQTLTPNVHGNAKFLLWHRYLLWTYEQMLRSDCGFDRNLPWFDETRYAGRFEQSSIFSSQWFGSVSVGGQCVTDGVSIICPSTHFID